jgi:hypothetical protein
MRQTFGRWGARLALALVGVAGAEAAHAQAATPRPLDSEMVAYFSGRWTCAGQFSNGKPIEAGMSFAPVLEGKWLEQTHTDRAPNTFQAISMWGVDGASGEGFSMLFDNFGGARRFESSGWSNRSISFERSSLPADPARRERFTYRAEADGTFRMSYDITRDGKEWRMVDTLLCRRG